MTEGTVLPDDFPAFLMHSDDDTPVPTWKQVTRSTEAVDPGFVAHLSQIVAGTNDEQVAIETWDTWPGNYQRSIALFVDKIYHEGWLDSVGPIRGTPWDGGFFFWPHHGDRALADVLNSKSGPGGEYTRCTYRAGLTARLGRWGHKAWKWGWIENDSPLAALHVGVFKDGSAEVHLDVFNPLCVSGVVLLGHNQVASDWVLQPQNVFSPSPLGAIEVRRGCAYLGKLLSPHAWARAP